jgi:DNA-binding response OmpR family regulator
MIVDDEEAYIRTLEWALRQGKFTNFRSFRDSTRVIEEFKQYQPDLVLLDLNMPTVDGFAILEQIRKIVAPGEFLPVLVLTGQNTAETRNRALASGASDFLPKPIDYNEVMLRIRNLLQTRFLYRHARELQTRLATLADNA